MHTLSLEEVERRVKEAKSPKELFGDDPDSTLRLLLVSTHPDRNIGDKKADALYKRVQELHGELTNPKPKVSFKSPKRVYEVQRLLGVGDVADVHLATGEGKQYAVKISRFHEGNGILENERETLKVLIKAAGDLSYRHYIPVLAEHFTGRDKIRKAVNVFLFDDGFFNLEEVVAKHPKGLDSKHLAWIFKRHLTVMGFVHQQGYVHGAILPPHSMIHAENHGMRLVGWGHSVKIGSIMTSVPAKYKAWYPPEVLKKKAAVPATDIYLAAKSLIYLAGGDPTNNRMPDSVPEEMQLFLRSCLLEGPSMRPQDAWKLSDEFNEMLQNLYGPPKFHRLVMT